MWIGRPVWKMWNKGPFSGDVQGSRIRVNGPMLGVVSETSGLPDPLTEPAKDETSGQTAGLL
jgi:hypothetical protein